MNIIISYFFIYVKIDKKIFLCFNLFVLQTVQSNQRRADMPFKVYSNSPKSATSKGFEAELFGNKGSLVKCQIKLDFSDEKIIEIVQGWGQTYGIDAYNQRQLAKKIIGIRNIRNRR